MTVRILVVDDESDVEMLFRQQFRRELREGRFSMDFAASGDEALSRVRTSDGAPMILQHAGHEWAGPFASGQGGASGPASLAGDGLRRRAYAEGCRPARRRWVPHQADRFHQPAIRGSGPIGSIGARACNPDAHASAPPSRYSPLPKYVALLLGHTGAILAASIRVVVCHCRLL
jgi:CheY-like chemotaxis protein